MTAPVLEHPDYEAYMATMRLHCCEGRAETKVREGEAFARGVRIGREEAHAETVSVEVGPSDYEVWRDALLIAAQRTPRNEPNVMHDVGDLEHEALRYAASLRTLGVPIQPSYEPADGDRHAYEQGDDGCTHCDADALDQIHEVG